MAKGRKLTTSRSERLLGSYGFAGNTHETEQNDVVELGEEDVWSMVDDMVAGHDRDWNPRAAVESTRNRYWNPVPRSDVTAGGGLSSAFEDSPGKMGSSPRIVHQFRAGESLASPRGRHVAASAPVKVPDWSKIYRVDSVESIHDSDDFDLTDDQDSDMVPPHEYLARAHARSRNSAANSVFVGVGRTLKGRDLSRVRDAVWSQTGFNG